MGRRNHRRNARSRKGTATIEFAVCLPVLVIVVLGSIESCNLIFLKQTVTEAAYQGALAGMKPEATSTDIEARVNSVLAARNISQSSVTVANGQFASVEPGDPFTIDVTVDANANRLGPTIIPVATQILSNVTALKQ